MFEQILQTIIGVIYSDFPKNSNNTPSVYDVPITGWYLEDRDIVHDQPGILFIASNYSSQDIAFLTKEEEYGIDINFFERYIETPEVSSRFLLEFNRIVIEILRKHRRIWVLTKCPICLKDILSPAHYLIEHNNIFGPYATLAQADFNAIWLETHSSLPSTLLPQDGLSTSAFYRVYDAVRANDAVNNLTQEARGRINLYIKDFRRPIRLLYNVNAQSLDSVKHENNLQKNNTLKITAKELIVNYEFGPSNIPTDSWD